jgi:hypothetical protein
LRSVAYAENDVFTAIGFRARAQDGCLYIARFHFYQRFVHLRPSSTEPTATSVAGTANLNN